MQRSGRGRRKLVVVVLELDSCTDVKFSRHLIVANVAFKDNAHAGAFVRHFVELLPEVPPEQEDSAEGGGGGGGEGGGGN
eukprot:753542-Hanusia_phi.AAC.3